MSGIHAEPRSAVKSLASKVHPWSGPSQIANRKLFLLSALCWCALSLQILSAQMIEVGTPIYGCGNSWFERQGVDFGFSFPGGQGSGSRVVGLLPNGQFTPNGQLQFTQGSFGSAFPMFGGFDPNAAGRFGFGVGGQGGGFRLGFEFGKGSTRTITSTAPSLMVQNGAGGFIGSGQWTPYVTGWIPVVGSNSGPQPVDNAVTRAVQSGQLQLDNLGTRFSEHSALPADSSSHPAESMTRSTAETASQSVAEIRATKAAERAAVKQQLAELMAEYDQHLAAGERELARLAIVRAIPLEKDASKKQELRNLLKSIK